MTNAKTRGRFFCLGAEGQVGRYQDNVSTKSYTYGDSTWKDLLTGYNGATLTYDTIGNLTSDGTWSYTWQHGRQLAGMSNGTKSLTFAYNADGKRVAKTYVNGEDTTEVQYYYAGNQLAKMTRGDKSLAFTYDSLGPRSVVYNGSNYYYLRNAQGDVLGIVNAYGVVVASYTYDAWGNVLSVTGSMSGTLGTLNPLRYRGYVYDTETKLYYLNSRYYNPATGRFINADIFVSTGQGVLGSNMFAYCGNNPVMGYDPSGESPFGTNLDLSEYGFIHYMVQMDCFIKFGWEMEIYVNGSRGRGRLDLLNPLTNEYYEVKSSRAYYSGKHIDQMAKYDVATIQNTIVNRNTPGLKIGAGVTRGITKVEGFLTYGIYDIEYRSVEPGVITYDAKINEKRAALAMEISVALILLAVCPQSIIATAPVVGHAFCMVS